jgi:oligosaccharide reducing-end xylanase
MHAFFDSRGMTTYGNFYELNGNMINIGRSVGLIAFNGAAALAATDSRAMLFVEQLWNQVPVSGTYRCYCGLL